MLSSHWPRNCKISPRVRNPQRIQRCCRPRLESLEERLTPATTFSVLNTADSGAGSLRQAILDANANPGADLIAFNIGGGGVQTIAPTSALPVITDPVTIDGTTQPGFAGSPIIELNGASAGLASGLVITAGNSTVRGLVINRFQAVGTFGSDGKGAGIVLSTNGGNVIEGNYVGTDVSGTAGLGNFRWGVLIFAGSSANRVGTNGDGITDAAERNVISDNGTIGNTSTGAGLIIVGTNDNVVAGNYMGTDVTGTVGLGNTNRGISIQSGAHGNRVGTDGNGVADAAERNLLSGNRRNGIVIGSDPNQPLTYGNTVAGNYIGTDAAGTGPLGNGRFGVSIFGAAEGNQVGGAAAALSNTIAFNGEAGVIVLNVATDPTFATGNRIQGNSIHSNVGLGIDLALDPNGANGVTPNDLGDADTGPNNLQNFPVLSSVVPGASTQIAGTLNSTPNTTFTLDFYASAAADPSGYGEGERYLGSATVTTDGSGNASFSVTLAATTVGEVVTATATDPGGNTSEFSGHVVAVNQPPTATNNAYSTSQATPVAGNVITDNTGSGADSDPNGDPLTVSSNTPPANGTLVLNADGSFVYTPDSTFSGTDSFTYTISDGHGGFSTATVTITVTPAGSGTVTTVPDTCLGGTALLIQGTSADDNIDVVPGGSAGTLKVTINGTSTTVAAPSGRIIVFGGAGNDNIHLAGSIANPAWLYGEDGNDQLNNGAGGGLLIGGNGNDQLTGGSGRDIMVGGQGADKLVGNANDDILIAGYTTKDDRASAGHEHFWCDVLEEWNSTNSFSDRVDNLRGPATQKPNAHNGASYLLPEVRDDNSADDIDMLQGSSGNDWFIYKIGEDKVVGQQEASN
jgi:Bacterial Ig domain/RTX calcium-binding nonapeptide repeat (4 copies)